jgi:hypothetical protein
MLEQLGIPRDRIRLEEWYRRQRAACETAREVVVTSETRQAIPLLQ